MTDSGILAGMTIQIEEAGRRARVQAAIASVLWCAGAIAGCVVADAGDVSPGVLGPTDPPPARCEPVTCEFLRAECGRPGDGCGGEPLDCGACPAGLACEYSLDPIGSRCVGGERKPASPCSALGVECGPVVDSAGDTLDCGACAAGLACGNWPDRCCGPRPAEDALCVDVSPNHRLYRWCYSEPEPGCVQVPDLIRGTSIGAWCCP